MNDDKMLKLKEQCDKEGFDINDALRAHIAGKIIIRVATPDGGTVPLLKTEAEKLLENNDAVLDPMDFGEGESLV